MGWVTLCFGYWTKKEEGGRKTPKRVTPFLDPRQNRRRGTRPKRARGILIFGPLTAAEGVEGPKTVTPGMPPRQKWRREAPRDNQRVTPGGDDLQ